ncbi:c-di-GMP-binding flagellar brake protein YcgR, contains PilZNR and PilZ domains [Paenibacillus sp. UNC496MF]|uniref:flagellar brake protein n=1 Tax=Paenibacillus sp. UNC496MF TaxID=1502753 RepID=UPI0008E48883|nr:flagellar brake domain-containing protein [Paenibacillus sp. UNC496MF]SFI56280.1 c-di-GMP-binding flagellar brake protein YcgR, contains PilZNR and PilZ domains [Paenibacillus sp. UNC496MF]
MLPTINQFLYLQIASSDEEEAALEYKSRIADSAADELLIDIPILEGTGRYKRLYLGDEISAYYMTQEGVKHYFNTHVLGFREDAVRLVRIRKPEPDSVTKIQRRHFLRVAAELEIAITLSGSVRFIGVTDDVGGGGISFMADAKWPMKTGTELDCWLLVPYRNGSVDHAQFKAEVVRVKPLENGKHQIMAKFAKIADGERQRIIRFCFERQLDFRKQ